MKKYLLLFVFSLIITNSNAQIFHENFDAPSLGDSVTTIFNGTHGFDINSRVQVSPNNCDSAFVDVGDTIILETNSFDLSAATFALLTFSHIAKVDYFDVGIVEVSPDNGLTWFQLTCAEYLGQALFCAQQNKFQSASYSQWLPADPTALPDNGWWKKETFDVSPFLATFPNAKVRFKLYDDIMPGGNGNAGWYIDNIAIDTTNLFYGYLGYNGFPYCSVPQSIPLVCGATAMGYNLTDSVLIHLYFGDGNDSIFYVQLQGTFGFNISLSHNYSMPGIYSLLAVMTSPDGIIDSVLHFNAVMIGTNCDSITGKIYVDYNSDCVYNGTDEPLTWGKVALYYNNQIAKYGWTDQTGNFSMNVPSNTYELKVDSFWTLYYSYTFQVGCPVSGLYSISSVPSTGNDFAMVCIPYPDLNIYHYPFYTIRPGMNKTLWIQYHSRNCQQLTATAKFILDPNTIFISSNPPPNSINGDTLIWSLSNFNINDWFNPQVTVFPTAVLNIGDTVCFTSIIEPVAGDLSPLDNIQIRCGIVNNSFDPNEKHVSPDGNITPSQELNYIINFQNTGNDTAYNVFILDTIHGNLDFNTLRINGASHNMTIDVLQGDVLKFNFNNIMLPDSGVNEPASHGFVSYSIKPKLNLANGTQITNTAGIYFDFNLPVVTNTTLNVIDSTLATGGLPPLSFGEGSGVRFYPNPADEFIVIESEKSENKNYEINISDVKGKQCLRTRNCKLPTKISIGNFQNGIYFINVKENGTNIKNLKLVKY